MHDQLLQRLEATCIRHKCEFIYYITRDIFNNDFREKARLARANSDHIFSDNRDLSFVYFNIHYYDRGVRSWNRDNVKKQE